jgi:acetolactate synthase-1/3 small subunit
MEIAQVFRASVVDVDADAVTVEVTGSGDKIEAMIRMVSPYGIRELVRSGAIAVGRGSRSITEGRALRLERSA